MRFKSKEDYEAYRQEQKEYLAGCLQGTTIASNDPYCIFDELPGVTPEPGDDHQSYHVAQNTAKWNKQEDSGLTPVAEFLPAYLARFKGRIKQPKDLKCLSPEKAAELQAFYERICKRDTACCL